MPKSNSAVPGSNNIHQPIEPSAVYDDGNLRIEYDNYFASISGQRLKLARTEFLILARLSKSPERIVNYEDLWNAAWDKRKPLSSECLKVYVYQLRRLLEPHGVRIETMVNVGYLFSPAAEK